MIASCSEDDSKDDNYKPNYLASIDATNLPKQNRTMTVFEYNESPSGMYDNKDHWFRVNQPMQVIQKHSIVI